MHKTDKLDDGYLGSGKRLKRSIRYYGKENFKREILFQFDNEVEMIQKEIELVTEEFVARKDTYNIALGGTGGMRYSSKDKFHETCILGRKIAREKLSEKLKNDPEFRKKYSESMSISAKDQYKRGDLAQLNWTGKKHSVESKNKIGISNSRKQKGINNSQFGTCWITNEIENKKIMKGDLIPEGWRLGRIMLP